MARSMPAFFNSTGADIVPVKAMALQADGKIVIGGFFTSIDGVGREWDRAVECRWHGGYLL